MIDWRGQGHFRALTEQQELWAIDHGFDAVVTGHGTIDGDAVANLHVPGDDLSLVEALAQVGQLELVRHGG